MNEAHLYEPFSQGRIRCTACRRLCVLSDGQRGFCGIRQNISGKLYLLTYGIPYGINIDPIEKKPVLHLIPGSRILSFGTTGCNYACKYCQNYDMSQRRDVAGSEMSPSDIVSAALEYGTQGIAYTYNEPTVFMEFAHDVGVLARREGLINIFVTNGYETDDALIYSKDFLDSITVDFKGNASDSFYRKYISVIGAYPIYSSLIKMRELGYHVEITDLVVPEVGDSLEDALSMIKRIKEIFGPDMPVSFLRFHPDYKMMDLPMTPVKTLEEHYRLAREMGMNYVYIGNVPGHKAQNTYCPNCGNLLVWRDGFRSDVRGCNPDSSCKKCGYVTNIRLKWYPKNTRGTDFIETLHQ